jgi:hypothetical protein
MKSNLEKKQEQQSPFICKHFEAGEALPSTTTPFTLSAPSRYSDFLQTMVSKKSHKAVPRTASIPASQERLLDGGSWKLP